jgi:hypothetical protein
MPTEERRGFALKNVQTGSGEITKLLFSKSFFLGIKRLEV